MSRLAFIFVGLLVGTPLQAGAAQENDADRDAAIFGTPSPSETEAARETDMFGAPDVQEKDSARDADIFGAAASPVTEPSGASVGRDDAIFGDGPVNAPPVDQLSQEAVALPGLVSANDDKLDVGGLFYLRGTYGYARGAQAESSPLRSPSLLDLYADARPSERVRVFARGRVAYDFALPETGATDQFGNPLERSDTALDQLWLKFDIERVMYVTLGKQPLKWGSGRFWNPTDFLNPTLRDPLAAFDVRLGVNLLKFHVPFESSGVNLYAIADMEGAQTPEDVGAAARAEVLVGTTEFAVSGSLRRNRPEVVGFDISSGLWDLDVRLETALRHNDATPYYEGSFDLTRQVLPRLASKKKEWVPQAVAGVEYAFNYSDEDSAALGVEYFYNEAGYENADLYPYLLFTGVYRPLYMGKHYGGVYALAAGPGSWDDTTLIASLLGNLSDTSYLGRFDYRVNVLTYVFLDAFVNYHFGSNGEFNYGLTVPAVPTVPQLANGLKLDQPRVDAGLGLRVNF